jgi:hypothetical protein
MRISRANLALVLAAAGAFLLTLIPLMRLYVSAQVFRAPLEQQSMTRSVAESATYLDPATMRIRTGTLVQTRWLLGDVLAGDEQRAVWGESVSLETEDGLRLDYHERRTGFDRRTGVTVNCCGAYVDEDTRAEQSGQAFRWPFQAEPRDHVLFDLRLRRQVRAEYEGAEQVRGVETYKFVQRSAPQRVAGEQPPVPRRLLGLPGRGDVGAGRTVEIHRTFWVEPVSGLPVRTEERLIETLVTADGRGRAVVLDATLRTSEGDVRAALETASFYRRWALLAHTVTPIGGGVLGAGCLAAAVWLVRRRSPAAQDQEQVPRDELADAR